MRLKPKNTTLNPRALLYKRFTSLDKSATLKTVYKTTDEKYWIFDNEALAFTEVEAQTQTTAVESGTVLKYLKHLYEYTEESGWAEVTEASVTTLAVQFANIAKYQTNNYYYVASFNYVQTSSEDGTNTQPIKGLITPLTSMTIKHFDDYIKIEQDDLVVINGHLYSVENPVKEHKHQPKDFNIYTLTLNSIL